MEHDFKGMVGFDFDSSDLGYDPLADFDIDADEYDESGGQQGPCSDAAMKARIALRADDRPASERIEELFDALAPRRRVMLSILSLVDSPTRSDALNHEVEKLQKHDFSVYSGYNYALLLEEAGAVRKVSEDGSDFDEEAEQVPDIVEIDGGRFYRPTDGKQVFWVATDEGRAYRDADDPVARLASLIAEEPQYRRLYADLLVFCSCEEGRSVDEIATLVDADPVSKNPTRHCSYFIKKLEDCGVLIWDRTWKASEQGKKGLDVLADGKRAAASETAH